MKDRQRTPGSFGARAGFICWKWIKADMRLETGWQLQISRNKARMVFLMIFFWFEARIFIAFKAHGSRLSAWCLLSYSVARGVSWWLLLRQQSKYLLKSVQLCRNHPIHGSQWSTPKADILISNLNLSSWLFQPHLKKKWIIFTSFGVKTKYLGNHHLETYINHHQLDSAPGQV